MTWPTDDLMTRDLESQSARPPRAEFLKLFRRVKTIIAARGVAGGVAALDATGKVPVAQLPESGSDIALGVPDGAASLDSNGQVPITQIPSAIARLASPIFTGSPTAPTQNASNRSTRLATTKFVHDAIRVQEKTITSEVKSVPGEFRSTGRDEGRRTRPTPAKANATLVLPEDDLIFWPFSVTVTAASGGNWTVAWNLNQNTIAWSSRAPIISSIHINATVTATLKYKALLIAQ